ncbi:MAG: nucleotide exchange factor GrpE [Gemmatimonadetes bacterium 13_1_40CM_4_69_8]|nr:MAG: nucleotide exchange factor GrpE [Gemmatimonadetes bacterium 13_1_40CM_4_69_8]
MTKHKHKAGEEVQPVSATTEPQAQPGEADGAGTSPALVEPAPAAVRRLEETVAQLTTELAEAKDKHLRLAAEFDNFRKRMVRERAEVWGKAQAEVVSRLVDALDDLARFAHVDPAQTDAKAIHDGVDLVERKIWKELDPLGVKRVDQVGVQFDPNLHEAVTTAPADEPTKNHTVGAVLQAGYRIGNVLLRPARVVVLTWQGEAQNS